MVRVHAKVVTNSALMRLMLKRSADIGPDVGSYSGDPIAADTGVTPDPSREDVLQELIPAVNPFPAAGVQPWKPPREKLAYSNEMESA